MDANLVVVIVALLVNVPTWFMLREDKRKRSSDAYSILMDALNKSGHTIDDLMKMLSEVPQLKSDLKNAQDEIKRLETELLKVNHKAEFFISFAKENWQGAQQLYTVVKENGLSDKVSWKPPDKFPTGPLPQDKKP